MSDEELKLQNHLVELMMISDEGSGDAPVFEFIRTFEESMILTNNAGLVVRVGGAEFQITIARSN